MSTDLDTLIARLRALAIGHDDDGIRATLHAPALRDISEAADAIASLRAQVEALQTERDRMRGALQILAEHAELSDDCQYGTLGTSFVRQIVEPALDAALQETGK